jgi:hypothetical protein
MAKKIIKEGESFLKGILDIVEEEMSQEEQRRIKKEARAKAQEEQRNREKSGEKKPTVAQESAKIAETKKVPEKIKVKDEKTGKKKTIKTGKMVDAPAVAFGSSNIKPLLGRQEALNVIAQLDRSTSRVPDRVLYGMGYLTDKSIIENASKGPKALENYFKLRENAFLRELGENPGLMKKYEAMAANNFENVFEKLAREKTPVVDPEDLLDQVIVGTMSDLTGTYGVSMINGIPVTIKHTGGTGFTSLLENLANDIGWAAALKTMRTFSGRVERVMNESNKIANVMPLDMGPEAVSYTSAMAQALMQQIKNMPGAIQPSTKRAFDKRFRMDYPQWVGLDHPLAEQQIAGIAVDGLEPIGPAGRKKFQYMVASAGMQKLGFPDWLSTARVLSKPGFMNKQLGYGQKFFKPKQGGPDENVVPLVQLGINNNTYDAGYLIDGFGKLMDSVPPEILFRDAWKKLGTEKTKPEKGKPRALTYSEKVKALQIRKDLYQEVDEEWVESVTKYLQDAAANKSRIVLPGGSKEGGFVSTDPGILLAMFGGSMLALGASSQAESAPFIGQYAKNFKKHILDKAIQMEEAGATREEIWKTTGEMGQPMFKNTKDKMWRAEVSAKDAKFDLKKVPASEKRSAADLAIQYAYEKGWMPREFSRDVMPLVQKSEQNEWDRLTEEQKKESWEFGKKKVKELRDNPYAELQDILDFPELFENYPELKTLPVGETMDRYYGGVFYEGLGDNVGRILLNLRDSVDNVGSVLMHEINHAIEALEGFGRGGASERFTGSKPYKIGRLQDAKKIAQALQKLGYKRSEVASKNYGVDNNPDDTGYKMNDGTFISLNDMGVNEKTFSNAQYFFSGSELIGDDPDLIDAVIDFGRTVAKTKTSKQKYEAYKKLVGETQARLVQARMGLSQEEIAKLPPFQTPTKVDRPTIVDAEGNVVSDDLDYMAFDAPDSGPELADYYKRLAGVHERNRKVQEIAKKELDSVSKTIAYTTDIDPVEFDNVDDAIEFLSSELAKEPGSTTYLSRQQRGVLQDMRSNNVETVDDYIAKREKEIQSFRDANNNERADLLQSDLDEDMQHIESLRDGQEAAIKNAIKNNTRLLKEEIDFFDAEGTQVYPNLQPDIDRMVTETDQALKDLEPIKRAAETGGKIEYPLPESIRKLQMEFPEEEQLLDPDRFTKGKLAQKAQASAEDPDIGYQGGFATVPAMASTGAASAIVADQTAKPQFQDRIDNPQNYPFVQNEDGSRSSHRMAAEVDQDGNWYAFPTLVMMPDGNLKQFEDPFEALRYNKSIGNVKNFGSDKESALKYAEGGYKTKEFLDYGNQQQLASQDSGAMSLGKQIAQNSEAKQQQEEPKTELQMAAENAAKLIAEEKAKQAIEDPEKSKQDDSLFNQAVTADYTMLDHLERETNLPLRKIAAYTKEFITGDERRSKLPESVRNLEEANPFAGQSFAGDFLADTKIGYSLLFGDQDEKLSAIKGNDPGATFDFYDADGNLLAPDAPKEGNETIVVNPSRGQPVVLNTPGWSAADSFDFLGESITYAPAGKAIGMGYQGFGRAMPALKSKGLGALVGGTSFGTEIGQDLLMQGLGSEQEVDPVNAALVAGMTGAFPLAGGAIGKAGEFVDPVKKALDPLLKILNTDVTAPSRSVTTGGRRK